MLLGDATDSVVHLVEVRAVSSGDMNRGVTCSRHQTVLLALYVRALTCLKTKISPSN